MCSECAPHVQRRCLHDVTLFANNRICRFDLRQHEMQKRKNRELEKAGIDPNDDEPWIAPEEQQRLDEEEEQRRAELEEQRKAVLQKRAEEDALKRQKFKEFRAKQISMSRNRKMEVAEKKEEARQHRREQNQRVISEDGAPELEGDDGGSSADAVSGADASGSSSATDQK
jgi:hypothetical protein